MKKPNIKTIIALAAGLIACATTAHAQKKTSLPPDCIKFLSYYQEDYKLKDYDRALENWRKALAACPANASQNLYVHGTTLMTQLYKKVPAGTAKDAVVDTILMLQDRRMAEFPKKKTDILNNKGLYMVNYRGSDKMYIFEKLDEIARELGPETSNAVLVNGFDAAVCLYREGKLEPDAVLDAYEAAASRIESKRPETPAETADNEKAMANIGMLLAGCQLASCERLIEIYSPRLQNEPENAALAGAIVRMMNAADDCAGNELYLKAVSTLHRLDPSHKSAYALYRMNAARDNVDKAVTYLEEAINGEGVSAETAAGYQYELSLFAYKNKLRTKAAEAARKAVELDGGYAGKAYIVLGNLWSSAPAEGELQQLARYWVAYDYYATAKGTDPSIADEADRLIGGARRYFPEDSEVFMYDLKKGDSFRASAGGMNAMTTVKTRN